MGIEHAERVQVKLFATSGAPEANALIPVFHQWITERKIDDDTLVDVADYSHVHHGPGVLLVGHASDWYYDQGEGRPGLLYSRKRAFEGDFEARLEDALRRAESACSILEEDTGATFSKNEILIRVPDRLHVRNDEEGLKAAAPIVERVVKKVLGREAKVEREGGCAESLTLRVRTVP